MTGLACLPVLRERIAEAICDEGMIGVLLMCMGDGNDAGEHDHDPGALGYSWEMANFDAIITALEGDGSNDRVTGDLTPFIVACPGYDGIIPAWDPNTRVNSFIRMARARLGDNRYLAIELSGGYAYWTGERNDWETPDGQLVDVVLQELPIDTACPAPPPTSMLDAAGGWGPNVVNDPDARQPWDAVWQVVGHLVDHFNRPAEMPTNDYPGWTGARWLAKGTPRGPFFYVMFEHSTYEDDRVHTITPEEMDDRRRYYLGLGCETVC